MRSRLRNRPATVRWLVADGWTLMIVRGPTRQSLRVHVPRWALLVLCCAWLSVMGGAAWLGFHSAEPLRAASEEIQKGARVATAPVPTSRQK